MREIVKLAIKLFVITAVAAIALAFTNSITKDRIAEQLALENELARQEVLKEAESFEQVDQDEFVRIVEALSIENPVMVEESFKGLKDEDVVGYTYKVLPKGYGGEITLLVGISIDGEITGIKVVTHSETPGLGAKATEESFQRQFAGASTDSPLTVIKAGTPEDNQVQAITGSTITTQAITDGVNFAMEVFKEMDK